MADQLTLEEIKKACDVLYKSPDIVKTPLLQHVQALFPVLDQSMDLYLKLENMQTTGTKSLSKFVYLKLNNLQVLNYSIVNAQKVYYALLIKQVKRFHHDNKSTND